MRLGFTGTRLGMTPRQRLRCAELLAGWRPIEVHHGDALGADAEMHALARDAGVRVVVHPPTFAKHRAFCEGDRVDPPRPKKERDRAVVDESDLLLATPAPLDVQGKRSGTWYTIGYARKTGKPVVIVWPDGHEESLPSAALTRFT